MESINGIQLEAELIRQQTVVGGEVPSFCRPGKSAYQYAVDGGYTGSEEEFAEKMAAEYLPLSGGRVDGEVAVQALSLTGNRKKADIKYAGVIGGVHIIGICSNNSPHNYAILRGVGSPIEDIDAAPKKYVDDAILSAQAKAVCIDIPNATGVEPYYVALDENHSLVVTQNTEEALDMYMEISVGTAVEGFYLYTLLNNEKLYFNLITDTELPGIQLQAAPVTVYEFLEGIVCHRMGEYAFAMFICDGALGFHPTGPSDYGKHSCDFISKDTNEVVSDPEADTPYQFGILYGHPEADIKLTGDVRDDGTYALSVTNTASDEPVILTGLSEPKQPKDAASKAYVDKAIANAGIGNGTGTGNGKSAYEYAVEGGYEGTEAEFAQKMAAEYVKPTDYATANKAGIVQPGDGLTLMGNGKIATSFALPPDILAKKSMYGAIAPRFLDYAVKVGVTTNTETLTAEEQVAAQNWLGFRTLTQKEYEALENPTGYYFIKGDA